MLSEQYYKRLHVASCFSVLGVFFKFKPRKMMPLISIKALKLGDAFGKL